MDNSFNLSSDLWMFIPELILVAGGLVLVIIAAATSKPYTGADTKPLTSQLSLNLTMVLLVLACVMLYFTPSGQGFNDSLVSNTYIKLLKLFIFAGSLAALIMADKYYDSNALANSEFCLLLIFCCLGMAIMVSANNFITLYLGLELQSLCLYILTAFRRDSAKASEAGLKYFVLGALSSAMLLYGISLIYGFAGSVDFTTINSNLASAKASGFGLITGLVFVISGFAFKLSAVPFHMWTPDVYEGSPTPVTGFIAGAPKVAAMGLFVRLLVDVFAPVMHDWQQVVAFMAIASMVLGAFAAIGQKNLKRLLAYSSISHMGYALIGVAAGSQIAVSAVVVYMIIYLIMILGVFSFLIALRQADYNIETISDLSGLAKNNRLLALAFGAIILSLAGLPPFAGFFVKLKVFMAAAEAGLYWLIIIAALATVVAAFYYLRIIKVMFFEDETWQITGGSLSLRLMLIGSSLVALFYMVMIALFDYIGYNAASSLF